MDYIQYLIERYKDYPNLGSILKIPGTEARRLAENYWQIYYPRTDRVIGNVNANNPWGFVGKVAPDVATGITSTKDLLDRVDPNRAHYDFSNSQQNKTSLFKTPLTGAVAKPISQPKPVSTQSAAEYIQNPLYLALRKFS